ncbi:hypothetical protein MPSEU_000514500 [Mayamaea pseudoterrestris]|nr:hypothetical protein MPSEU_000514500 [Mayamaea pseudoterrestris]
MQSFSSIASAVDGSSHDHEPSMLQPLTMSGSWRGLYFAALLCNALYASSFVSLGIRKRRYCPATIYETSDEHDAPMITRSSFIVAFLTLPFSAQANSDNYKQSTSSTTSSFNRETFQESVSGAIAGSVLTVVKSIVKYPLDTATVRLQMPNSQYSLQRPVELLKGSYRGVLIPLLANIPAGATFFGAKDVCKAILKHEKPFMSKWVATCLAVGVAQLPYWIVRNPSEVVKTRQQSGATGFGQCVSVAQAYQSVYNETNSYDGFFVGYWENVIYAYPADVVKFGLYEAMTGGGREMSAAEGAIAGAFSTAIAQFLCTPLDVVRTRVMVRSESSAINTLGSVDEGKQSSATYIQTLYKLGRDEGWEGLFAGAAPRVVKALISGAVQFATYEETKQAIESFFRQQISYRT